MVGFIVEALMSISILTDGHQEVAIYGIIKQHHGHITSLRCH